MRKTNSSWSLTAGVFNLLELAIFEVVSKKNHITQIIDTRIHS